MVWLWTTLFLILLLNLLLSLLRKNANFPPGPIPLPILGHLHLFGKNPHQDLYHLSKKHGSIMGLRFGFVPVVVVSSPSSAELILKTHGHIFASRPRLEAAQQIGYGQRSLIFGSYGLYWRNMRKLCTLELLSSLKIDQFRGMRETEVGLKVESIKRAAERQEAVDLSMRVLGVSGDMNCLMTFGRKFADSELDETGFKDVMREVVEVFGKFNLGDYIPYVGVLDLQGLNRRMKRLARIFDEFLEKIIDDHALNKNREKENKDFLDTMMGIMESGETPFEFDRRHVKAVLLDLLIAGMDTSATAVEWTMSELLRHPQVMAKLQQELESVVGTNHMVEEPHLDKLKYLDCVIKETQRLHPVAPLLLPHESMEDCNLNGFHIPKKSQILVNVWAIGRDARVWTNPKVFSPERFTETDIDLIGHDFQLIPFGSGRRRCPGMHLGLTVVKHLVAQLVHCFEWKLPGGMDPKDLDMSEHFGSVTGRANHLMAIPSYRLTTLLVSENQIL